MAKVNKYLYQIVVQEFTPGYGWFDISEEDTRKDAKRIKADYINNGIHARIINRRVMNPAYQE
jgi:hypothetical protein